MGAGSDRRAKAQVRPLASIALWLGALTPAWAWAAPGPTLPPPAPNPSTAAVITGTATVTGAVIAAVALIAGILLRDLFIARMNEARTRRVSQAEVFRNYVGPLADACEKLIWRFSEIFIAGRHQFLKLDALPLEYNQYKRESTLFRIATLIGWMRGIDRELSSLPLTAGVFSNEIYSCLDGVRRALAEGVAVEERRLEQLLAVWRLERPIGDISKLAADLEVRLYRFAGDALKKHSDGLPDLDKAAQLAICKSLSAFLCERLSRAPIPAAVLAETVAQAIDALSFREALIYRDWQDAIGDAMLRRDEDSPRRYGILGFADFDTLLQTDRAWFTVFRSCISDIDFETPDPSDYRGTQLRQLAIAVAKVVVAIAGSPHRDLIDPAAVEVAREIVKLPQADGPTR